MSEAAASHCPTCNGPNPIGAKFCSACRASLVTAPPPVNPAPPPPPPPRPGIGGMMGQMGGKAVTRQISGDAATIYNEIAKYVRGLPSTELQHEMPTQQLSAKVAYKDFVSTGGIVIAVDTNITVAPTTPGQAQVSVTTKTDMSSTNKIWIYNLFFAVCGLFILPFPMWAIIFVIALIMSFWLMSTSPGQNVSNNLFQHLAQHAPALAGTSVPAPANSTTSAPTPGPMAAPAPPQDGTLAPKVGDNEDEIFERIKKLAQLKEVGAITETDFESKKADLLARI